MPEILSIKNVTASHSFAGAPGQFHHTITAMPIHPVDEIVIRAVNWYGEAADPLLYLLWSNITNDFVASFCGPNINPHFPGTRNILTHPPPNMLEFKLFHPRSMSDDAPFFDDDVTGAIAIHLEFISYKKRHIA